jgi:esterase/lipase superfamily enzyme
MPDTLRLLLQLIEIAPTLERAFGGRWPAYRDDLLELAGRLENEGGSAALDVELDAILARLLADAPAAVRADIRRVMAPVEDSGTFRDASVNRGDAGQGAEPGRAWPDHVVEVPVFYGTDRRPSAAGDGYLGRRGEGVSYGVARVTVPTEGRGLGELSGPRWWRLEFKADLQRHVILSAAVACDRDAFLAGLRSALATADDSDLLLFLHGYNVGFADAARRAAQLAVDLKFRGRTLLFSWASAGDPRLYAVDEASIDWSERHFRDFLRMALTETGASRLHVVAHSMGNRALVRALEHIDTGALAEGSASLCQVIFAAPDIDAARFKDLAAVFRGRADRCTLYASSGDVALKASKLVHGYARAGEAGDSIVVVDGVDTVDASRVDTSLIGLRHSYFGSARSILSDIAALVNDRKAPALRFDIQAVGAPPHQYWAYRA